MVTGAFIEVSSNVLQDEACLESVEECLVGKVAREETAKCAGLVWNLVGRDVML